MLWRNSAAGVVFAVSASLGLGEAANAGPYTTVDLSTYVDTSFGNLIGAGTTTLYPTGTTIGETGVPFDIANAGASSINGYGLNYWGGFLGTPSDRGTTLAITGLNIASTTAYTLINTTFGTVGDDPTTVTFKTATSSVTFNLFEGTELRDYNNDGFNNLITPPTAEWFSNGGPADGTSRLQQLDQQTYDLSGLGGGNIIEVDVTSNPICAPATGGDPCPPGGSFGGEDTIFSGLTFLSRTTEVPEPASLVLLGSGLLGFGIIRRRRKTI